MPDAPSWLSNITPGIITLIGGGAFGSVIGSVLQARTSSRRDRRDDFLAIVEERRKENASLLERLQRADVKIDTLEADLMAMGTRLQMIEATAKSRPFPEWAIDTNGRYTWCNVAYEQRFLATRGRNKQWLLGKSHSDVWPGEAFRVFAALDREATLRATRTARRENVEIPDEITPFLIAKWAVYQPITDVHIGFHGLAIPNDF